MDSVSVEFRYPRGRMILYLPTAMEEMPIANMRKIFSLLKRNYGFWLNNDSVRQFASYIPEVLDGLREEWETAEAALRDDYMSLEFDQWGNKLTDRGVIGWRRKRNNHLTEAAKAARQRYERFQKRAPKLEKLCRDYEGR